MKRLKFHRTIVAIAMMLIGWLPSLAHDFEVDGIFYNKTSDNTVAVTYKGDSYSSYSNEYIGDVVIPSSVDYNGITYSVTSIGDEAFSLCTGLTSIVIPNRVTSIGRYAFWDCTSLTSIEIPNSVTSIGYGAFSGCSSLTSIEIPNSVTYIGNEAFSWCSSLTRIEIPNSVTNIGYATFNGCSSLTSIQIPNSVTSIGDDAFAYCYDLTRIEIPNSVTSIGSGAFYGCDSLTSVIWNSVRCSDFYSNYIPFENCPNITSFTFGDEVEHIPAYLCYNLSSLTSIEIPNSVTSIGDGAFAYCESLTKITCLATNPPAIKSNTFSNYSAELYVPAGCISAYQSANYWKYFNIKELPIILSTFIALNKTSASLKATETLTLVATVLPENATNKSVTWKSSNVAVATVDANGLVTAIAVGEATIIATTTDGSNLSATCKVTVVPTLAVSIELDQTEASVEEKSELQLTATILPEHATNKEVAWSSSDKWVASVDNTGLVTMYSAGEVVITATTTDGTNLSATCRINVYSGIDGVNGDDVIVATVGDNIVVKNAKFGSVVNVYALNGALVASEDATDGSVVVEAPAKGIYVVKVGKQTVKVII